MANKIVNTSSCFFDVGSGAGTVCAEVASARVIVKGQTGTGITKK